MESIIKKYTEANREAWNEVMPRHQRAAKAKWDDAFMESGYVCFGDVELALLSKVDIQGISIAHLCCNNGIELLSLKNLGAGDCVGFDISEAAILEAQERAERVRISCQYVRSDVYDIGPEYENRFDLVYLSSGTLGWMPDIGLFFERAAALLRDRGKIFIHEINPFSEMLPFDDADSKDPLRIIEPYFKDEPYVEFGGLDYVGGTGYSSIRPQYWFVHKLSDIMMGLIDNSVEIVYFSEHETDISSGHKRVELAGEGIPLSYFLIGEKSG